MQELQPFVGEWRVEVTAPWATDVDARATFERDLDGRFLIQRVEIDVDVAPDSFSVIAAAAAGDGYTQHYFDSRGVVRLYAMTFDGRTWTLERTKPDFSAFDFAQRFTGTFSDGGDRIDARWEITNDAGEFELDFEISYVRI